MLLLLFCDTIFRKVTLFILVLFINWVFDFEIFSEGWGQLARFRMLTKVIKALIFCFLASVQGYSSSKVNFSSVLKQADL